MTETLEQRRAADAWLRSQGCSKDYANLVKGLPALIMNSGLMQVLAFLQEKGSKPKQKHCDDVGRQLRKWLCSRFQAMQGKEEFAAFMEVLFNASSSDYQQITAEAHAYLRWLRQMSAAANPEKST